jgi:hypothetical protein
MTNSAAGLAKALLTLIGAAIVGFAIPTGWIKVGSMIQASSDTGSLAFPAIATAFLGIVASYYLIIVAAGLVAGRRIPVGGRPAPRRYNWNRSMRDERHQAPELNALETLFVVTALLVGCAYMVWFFIFAGSPLPS